MPTYFHYGTSGNDTINTDNLYNQFPYYDSFEVWGQGGDDIYMVGLPMQQSGDLMYLLVEMDMTHSVLQYRIHTHGQQSLFMVEME